MKIEILVKDSTENEKLKTWCQHLKQIKVGSLACQSCKYFSGSTCTNTKEPKYKP